MDVERVGEFDERLESETRLQRAAGRVLVDPVHDCEGEPRISRGDPRCEESAMRTTFRHTFSRASATVT